MAQDGVEIHGAAAAHAPPTYGVGTATPPSSEEEEDTTASSTERRKRRLHTPPAILPVQFSLVATHGRENPTSYQRSTDDDDDDARQRSVIVASFQKQYSKSSSREGHYSKDQPNNHHVRRATSSFPTASSVPPRTTRPLTQYRSRWDHERPKLQPTCNPNWLGAIQRRLPWYADTVAAGGGPWLSARAWEYPYRWLPQEVRWRWNHRGDRWLLCIRFTITALLVLTLLFINVIAQQDLYQVSDVPAIYDWFHSITTPLNQWVNRNHLAFNVIVLFASGMMDLLFLLIWIQWVAVGDSFRLPIAYSLLYALRAFIQRVCQFPFPKGYIWHAPTLGSVEIPSLTVPYQPSDDFFFSGHVACCVLATVEQVYYRCWWGVAFTVFVTLIQFFVMTITRGHYAIDMIAGAVIAHWVHMVASSAARPVDQWLSLPPRPVAGGFFPKRGKNKTSHQNEGLAHS